MITIQEFINKYNGKALYNDYGAQCVLLVKTFAKEVLGIQLGYFGGSAINGYYNKQNTFKEDLWVKIPNTPEGVPDLGSLIFFEGDGFSKEYGHVGVVVEADVNRVRVLEQNGGSGTGTGKGDDAIRITTYNYSGVIGWMTPIIKEESEYDFYEELEDYSNDNIVVLYKGKYYINLNNKRVEVNEDNFMSIL